MAQDRISLFVSYLSPCFDVVAFGRRIIFHAGFGLKTQPHPQTEYGDQIFVRVDRAIAII
jgi:hypothetical protein